jgi:ATP-dependent Clp protease ATP-binding subunit ClpA
VLRRHGLGPAKVREAAEAERKGKKYDSPLEGDMEFEYLKKYGRDLVEAAQKGGYVCVKDSQASGLKSLGLFMTGQLDPVIGRDAEIRRVVQVLCSQRKSWR